MSDQSQNSSAKTIALQLPAEVVQMCLQALSTQPYRVVVNAINIITEQYEAHRLGNQPAPPPATHRRRRAAPPKPPAGA